MIPPAVRALLRTTPTVAPIPHRAVLSITGSQALEFLNGIIASTAPSSSDCHFYTAFLHAQGRVLHDAFVYSHTTPDGKRGYLVEYDGRPSDAPPLLSSLKRFILRAKVRIRDVSDEYDVWSSWGSEKESRWETQRTWSSAHSGVIEPDWSEEGEWPWGQAPGTIRDRRAVGMGHRLLVRKGDRPMECSTHDVSPSEAYTLHRILHGVPEGNTDIIPTHSFPMESNLDIMGALDFRKGCYVGQELTVRTYHTGTLRKRIWPVTLYLDDKSLTPLASHLDIKTRLLDKHDDSASAVRVRPRGSGKLLSNVGSVGLALLRIEHVLAVEKGEARLEIELPNSEDNDKKSLTVGHWHPDSWPRIHNES